MRTPTDHSAQIFSRLLNAGAQRIRRLFVKAKEAIVRKKPEGARRLAPSFGQKIYRLSPLLECVNHRIDGAQCFALLILVGCWFSWTWLLQIWLGTKWYPREYKLVIYPLALIFIAVDAVIFYLATAQFRWGAPLLSYTAMLATLVYAAVLIFVTFVGIVLKQETKKEKP